jgi:hypothetical protein
MAKRNNPIFELFNRTANQPGVSRRGLLRNAAVAMGGAIAYFGAAMPAQAKMSLKAAAYRDTPKGDQTCANCSLFKSPSSCTLVEGTVSPNGWCRFYAKNS